MTPAEISALVSTITDDMKTVVSDEIALAKAEFKPMAKKAGVGTGMFAGALWFVISATVVLWFLIAAGFAWLYGSLTSLSVYASVFFAALTTFILIFVVVGIFALFGMKSFKSIKGFEKTPETISEAAGAISAGLTDGATKVHDELQAAAEVKQRKEEAREAARVARKAAKASRSATTSRELDI